MLLDVLQKLPTLVFEILQQAYQGKVLYGIFLSKVCCPQSRMILGERASVGKACSSIFKSTTHHHFPGHTFNCCEKAATLTLDLALSGRLFPKIKGPSPPRCQQRHNWELRLPAQFPENQRASECISHVLETPQSCLFSGLFLWVSGWESGYSWDGKWCGSFF